MIPDHMRRALQSAILAVAESPEQHRSFLTERLAVSLLKEAMRPLGRLERLLVFLDDLAAVLRQYARLAVGVFLPGVILWLLVQGYRHGNLDFILAIIGSGAFGTVFGRYGPDLLSRTER